MVVTSKVAREVHLHCACSHFQRSIPQRIAIDGNFHIGTGK